MATSFEPNRFNAKLEQAAAWIAPAMERHINMWDSPQSLDYWQYRIEYLQNHNADRVYPSREQLRNTFGFNATKTMTVEWANPIGGEVQVNGMSGLGQGWQGAYFGECPVRLAAIPAEGYSFLGWEENGHTLLGLLDPALPFAEVALYGDDTFKALFGPCLSGVTVSIVEGDGMLEAIVSGSVQPLTVQWWLDGQPIGWGFTFSGVPVEGMIATASNGECTVFSEPYGEGQATGVIAYGKPAKFALSLMPNPARGMLQVQGQGDRLEVFSAQGKVQYAEQVQGWPVQLDVSAWPAGVFVVRVSGANGSSTERLIVK